MNKKLIYNIIDNKINKINCVNFYNIINVNDVNTILSAIKLNKSSNLTINLNLSDNNYNKNDFIPILNKLFNYLINDKKIIKLSLLLYNNISYHEIINYLECNKIINVINSFKYNPIVNIIYNIINNNKTLQSLNISGNNETLKYYILKALVENENNTLKSLNIQGLGLIEKDSLQIRTQILNKNILTSLKLTFSIEVFIYYNDFINFLKSIENNTSLQKLSIEIDTKSITNNSMKYSYEIILLLLLNSILKNKHIKTLKINFEQNQISVNTFNYLLLNNKNLNTITFKTNQINTIYYYKNKYFLKLLLNDNINRFNNDNINNYIYNYYTNNINSTELNNIINNIINKDINLYDNINNYSRVDCNLYNINTIDYISLIKNIDVNMFMNKNYTSYYKQLQDKLNSINIVFK